MLLMIRYVEPLLGIVDFMRSVVDPGLGDCRKDGREEDQSEELSDVDRGIG